MSLTPLALILLNVQRQRLEHQPHEREVTRGWAQRIDHAREQGQLIVLIQWDGAPEGAAAEGPQAEPETFSKGWTLHPDFRAEAGDLLVRARRPDAFAGTDLEAELRARAVRELHFLALPDAPELAVTAHSAREAGFTVTLEVPTLA
jgi:nicotinamidase-related amidase